MCSRFCVHTTVLLGFWAVLVFGVKFCCWCWFAFELWTVVAWFELEKRSVEKMSRFFGGEWGEGRNLGLLLSAARGVDAWSVFYGFIFDRWLGCGYFVLWSLVRFFVWKVVGPLWRVLKEEEEIWKIRRSVEIHWLSLINTHIFHNLQCSRNRLYTDRHKTTIHEDGCAGTDFAPIL